ncbi:MAG: tRNA (adenosine(37)-N6)-threonylcarbamoyltransferase complex dimerization subunit type 1 TsaB [Bacteroidota bacterium]|nr:tRNA (adenosine(37)-N6)-threonylcarbamoyltransferase complex dimerization subunit type 1 TsaB [Bacteroidota bacterium]
MALILHIETSTNVCSVALSHDGNILFSQINREGPSHASLIGPYLDEALKIAESNEMKLDAVAVSSGPGSYTGLRIGVAAAKGVCYAKHIPLIAVPTLELLADTYLKRNQLPDEALVRPVMDARRMEVYSAVYDSTGHCLKPAEAIVVDNHTFDAELAAHPVYFVGNGALKLHQVIHSKQAHFEETLLPVAESMIALAEKAYGEGRFENVAYFEPFYLKDFVATVKKHLIPPIN